MLKWLFGKKAQKIEIRLNDVFNLLELNDEKFKDEKNIHAAILAHLNKLPVRGGGWYGKGKAFYTNRDKTLVIKAPPTQFLDEPEKEDDHIPCSPCIAYTEQPLARGKRGFGLIIRKDSNNFKELYENSIIFALYGVCDKEGLMSVKKLMVPGIDRAGRLTELKTIDITNETVKGALRYAELCAQALYNKEPFFPRELMKQSLHENLNEVGINIVTPAP